MGEYSGGPKGDPRLEGSAGLAELLNTATVDPLGQAGAASIELYVDAGLLTVGEIQEAMRRVVEYARSKGAPDDAAILLTHSNVFRGKASADWGVQGTPPPSGHEARIIWHESAATR